MEGGTEGSSPHARGKRQGWLVGVILRGLIPACAGKTPADTALIAAVAAHPRMRGENA